MGGCCIWNKGCKRKISYPFLTLRSWLHHLSRHLKILNSLYAKPLNALEFSLYGDVIELREDNLNFSINRGTAVRHHALSKVELSDANDEAIVSIFLTERAALPFTAEAMECHPLGSQAFIPLSDSPYLVAVAPAGQFKPQSVELFIAQPNQGINYHRGVWHHYILALREASRFLVIDRQGPGTNCEEVKLDPHLIFSVED